MKTICTSIAIALAAVLQAAVPTEWQVRVGPKATVYQAERYHGDALALRATLTAGGMPLPYEGAARLYAQTNGMGAAWWDLAAATVEGNVLTATWLPSYDTGADVVDVFLGAPGNYQAHARIRFLPSPGATPGLLPLPTPVLDFADVTVLNAPYYTQAETDARIVELAPSAQLPGNWLAVSNAAMSAAAQSDLISATNALAESTILSISSTNPAFAAAVRAVPITGADSSDLAEIAEYGSYGTVGAAILALIAGLAALKRRMGSAETAIAAKADAADLRYSLVTPTVERGAFGFPDSMFPVEFTTDGTTYTITNADDLFLDGSGGYLELSAFVGEGDGMREAVMLCMVDSTTGATGAPYVESLTFNGETSTTLSAALTVSLTDRACNAVVVDGAATTVTLTLPAAVPGHIRDLIVRTTLSADALVTFAAPPGDAIAWDSSGDPSGAFAAGTHLLRLTEVAQGVFHAADMLALDGLEAALAAINGGDA